MLLPASQINNKFRESLRSAYLDVFSFGILSPNQLAVLLKVSDKCLTKDQIIHILPECEDAYNDLIYRRILSDSGIIHVNLNELSAGNFSHDKYKNFIIKCLTRENDDVKYCIHDFMEAIDFVFTLFRMLGSKIVPGRSVYSDDFSIVFGFDIHKIPEAASAIPDNHIRDYKEYELRLRMDNWERGIIECTEDTISRMSIKKSEYGKVFDRIFMQEKADAIREGDGIPEHYGVCATPMFADAIISDNINMPISEKLKRQRAS